MDKIQNKNLNVRDVFQHFYRVPDYQREYVWKEKHVTQLLEDIYEEFSNDRKSEYFIGSIVVCENDDKRYEIIDGQQRLTTLFVALSAFKNHLKSYHEDISDIQIMLFSTTRDASGKQIATFRLDLQYENGSRVLNNIVEDRFLDAFQGDSEKNIFEAYCTIRSFMEANFKSLEEIRPFLGYFLNNVRLIQIETPNISDALKIFETINERGVGLNPMDLLKNLLFRQIDKKDFDKLKNKWKQITSLLEKKEEKPLRFLRYFIMANYQVKNKKGEEIIREDELYDWIVSNKDQCNYEQDPFVFVDLLKASAEAYVNYLDGKDPKGQVNIHLNNIRKLSGGSFRQHLILLLAAKDLKQDWFNHLAKQIEVLIFYYILTREPTKEFERKFSKWAKEIKAIDKQEKLNMFIEQKLLSDVSAKSEAFEKAFLSLHEGSLQGYRFRYILGKLDQFIDQQKLGGDERSVDDYLSKGVDIEHILPQTPEKMWGDFGADYDKYKAMLGNLTLLEQSQNSVARNDCFAKKKEIYKTSRFHLTKSIAVIERVGNDTAVNRANRYLKSFDSWDKNAIEERQKLLFRMAQDVWRIQAMK